MTRTAAETMGMLAFAKGRPAQPGCDSDLMTECKKVGSFSKKSQSLMRAWLRGWTKANVAAT